MIERVVGIIKSGKGLIYIKKPYLKQCHVYNKKKMNKYCRILKEKYDELLNFVKLY